MISATFPWSIENLFAMDNWFFNLRINNYQIVTVLWNLLLLVVPYLICSYLDFLVIKSKYSKIFKYIIGIIGAFIWLLFIPNTAYVITDIRHIASECLLTTLNRVCIESSWLIPIFFAYSLVGWVAFVYLLRQAKDLFGKIFGEKWSRYFIVFLMPVISLGLLLGLVQRLNSWEAILFPIEILKIAKVYITEAIYVLNWLTYTVFLYILYYAGDHLFKKEIKN